MLARNLNPSLVQVREKRLPFFISSPFVNIVGKKCEIDYQGRRTQWNKNEIKINTNRQTEISTVEVKIQWNNEREIQSRNE